MLHAYINGDGILSLSLDIPYYVEPSVLKHPIIRQALEKVEGVYKIEGLAMYSKEHGVKSPENLSLGVKALIMCYYQAMGTYKELISSACMGDNIGVYLQKMSLEMDMHVAWDSYLPMDWKAPILAKNMANGNIITNVEDFQREIGWKGGTPGVPATPFNGF